MFRSRANTYSSPRTIFSGLYVSSFVQNHSLVFCSLSKFGGKKVCVCAGIEKPLGLRVRFILLGGVGVSRRTADVFPIDRRFSPSEKYVGVS